MAIFSVYVVNKAGGLIYQLDSYAPRAEAEKTFSYPLDLLLKLHDERVLVAFGQRDGIRGGLGSGRRRGVGRGRAPVLRKWVGCRCGAGGKGVVSGPLSPRWNPGAAASLTISFTSAVGHAVLAINGMDVNGKYTADGKEVLEYLGNPANYPVSIRFGRPRLTSNEKLMLASMFHS